MPTLSAESLTKLAIELLVAAGVPQEKAGLVARSLVAANLRGVDSHGLQLLPYYLEQIRMGNIRPLSDGRVASETGGCWAQRMSSASFIGIVMCNASPLVAPWQGKEPRFGTNPIAMSVPGPDTWLLDMATTTVALGKVLNAQNHGRATIPDGWAMDSEGVSTNNTETALAGLLTPLGGYKGSGLAMMAEILCAVLSGGAMSNQLGGIRVQGQPMRTSQFFLAIDVARFMPLQDFERRMRELVALVKSSKTARGYDEILVAGDPEWRTEARRKAEGIPLSEGVWQSLTDFARQSGVALPA